MRTKLIAAAVLVVLVAAAVVLLRPREQQASPNANSSPQQAAVPVVHAAWTGRAGERIMKQVVAQKLDYSLPELRVYDPRGQLIFFQSGAPAGSLAGMLAPAITADRAIAGPTWDATLGDLETADHRPVSLQLPPTAGITVFDYWADWCVPCKILEKELMAWAATRPAGSVRVVKAEADLMKVMRSHGMKVIQEHE